MPRTKGFTLIELMIVVAIIAILVAIAIPQYQGYLTRAQFSESQTIAKGIEKDVALYWSQSGTCPSLGEGALASTAASYSGKYVQSATVTTSTAKGGTCNVVVTFKSAGSVSDPIAGKQVTFSGTNLGGSFLWVCAPDEGIGDQYVPRACRS